MIGDKAVSFPQLNDVDPHLQVETSLVKQLLQLNNVQPHFAVKSEWSLVRVVSLNNSE